MLDIQIAGRTILYKDLNDLNIKLNDLLGRIKKERLFHVDACGRLRKDEKKISKLLGDRRKQGSTTDTEEMFSGHQKLPVVSSKS